MIVTQYMERDELILKWLNNDLTATELEAFKKLEDYEALTTLQSHLQGFKAKEYNTSEELKSTLKAIEIRKKAKKNWLPIVMRVAAILVVCLGILYYTTTLDTQVSTLIAENKPLNCLMHQKLKSMRNHQLPITNTIGMIPETYHLMAKRILKLPKDQHLK